jgi:photosystem II stability/assembly factor-like uncharacterized protein
MTRRPTLLLCFAFLLLAVAVLGARSADSPPDTQSYAGLRWRLIGPFRGGRSLTAAGVPGHSDTYYFGAVGGGVWKTNDSGRTWNPIFDDQPIASIGALAIAPSDPNVIYVGSGEADMRSDITFGNGMYKSSDAGKTWRHVGLADTRQIGRIFVDPRNPNIVLVAALGHAYGPNAERGVFRSVDGGRNWQKVLFRDENTGAIDLAADPDNAQTVFASLWNARRTPWSAYPPISGAGSGIYKSSDGGLTWKQVTGGLPAEELGRVGLAVAAGTGGQRVYAILDHPQQGGLYRSDDAGANWERVSSDPRIHDRGWYFGTVTVDPRNLNSVFLPNVALYHSSDGGRSFNVLKGAPGGDDYHFLWINPQDTRRMILASDQGTVVTVNAGVTWSSWYNQPTAQFYHVATDNEFPYRVYGSQQDSGTASVASRSDFGQITARDWSPVAGGESGYLLPDPSDARIVYGGDTYGGLYRFDRRTGQAENISPDLEFDFGKAIAARRFRFTWTSPLAFSPQDARTIYFGAQVLLATNDRGKNWDAISPDLTGADAAAQSAQGPVTVENARARGLGVVYTIAPSPVAAGQIWVGTDTGMVQLTRDGGHTWSNVTPAALPAWSKISILDASASDAATAYIAVDRHRLEDYQPYIYRTHDYGRTWKKISDGIPEPAFVRAVRADAVRRGLLFAGTELGVYFSLDDGDHWQSLQLNLPVAPIHDLVVHGNDLVVATHGRSFWILDDITPLRAITPEIRQAGAYLFAPAKTYRVRRNVNQDTPLPPETAVGENPPAGAVFYYNLASAPASDIQLEVRDAHGALVRAYSSAQPPRPSVSPVPFEDRWLRTPQALPKQAGLNRFVWDLRYAPPNAVTHQYPSAATPGDTPAQPEGPRALPGSYEARLTVAGRTLRQPLELTMDPRVGASADDLARQFELERSIAEDLDRSYAALQEIKAVRERLKNRGQAMRNAPQLDRELAAIAGTTDAHASDQTLGGLNTAFAALQPVVDSADASPTAEQNAAYARLHQALERKLAEWSRLKMAR